MASSMAIVQKAQEAASRETLCTFALPFRQKRPDVNLYSAVVPLKDLLGRCRPDTYRHDNREGYQRPLTVSRLRQGSSPPPSCSASASRIAPPSRLLASRAAAASPASSRYRPAFASGWSTASTGCPAWGAP